MIIVRLEGGLGNQMFQYAFAKSVATNHNTEFKLDTTFLLDRTVKNTVFRDYDLSIYKSEAAIASQNELSEVINSKPEFNLYEKIRFKLFNSKIPYYRKNEFFEKEFYNYDKNVFKSQKNAYFLGYWQHQNYFSNIESQLKSDFTFKNSLSEQEAILMGKIKSSNSVAINVRRTDYISDKETNEFMGVLKENYYVDAINLVRQKITNPKFYIFSDDVEWCRKEFSGLENHFIVDHSYAGNKFASYLQLMSSCKNFIIPNSTFAWWAVWLSPLKNKVVVQPKRWVNDSKKDTSGLIFKSSLQL